MKLSLKTIGSAQGLVESIDFDSQEIANAFQDEISGGRATAKQAEALTQDFITKHNVSARYASGTFLGFRISDEASEEFMTFAK